MFFFSVESVTSHTNGRSKRRRNRRRVKHHKPADDPTGSSSIPADPKSTDTSADDSTPAGTKGIDFKPAEKSDSEGSAKSKKVSTSNGTVKNSSGKDEVLNGQF